MNASLCTYVSTDCDDAFIRKALLAAQAKLSKLLEKSRKGEVRLRPPHDRCLEAISRQISNILLAGECFYVLCDPDKKKGELSTAIDCAKIFGVCPGKRGDALIHGKQCLLIIIEETDSRRKTGERLLQQIRELYGIVAKLIESEELPTWLDKCTRKPKSLKINPLIPMKSREYETLWRACGGFAIGIVPQIPQSLNLRYGLVLKTRAKVFETKPYIMILTKSSLRSTSPGLLRYFRAQRIPHRRY